MDFKIILGKEININKWSDFVINNESGNIFQTPEMFEVFRGTKNYKPEVIAVVDSKDDIQGILVIASQKEYSGLAGNFTTRATVWGGPVISNQLSIENRKKVLNQILQSECELIGRKNIYVQHRNLMDMTTYQDVYQSNEFTYFGHLNLINDLTLGEDGLWNCFDKKRKTAIRKAEKEGVTVKIASTESQIKEIYGIYRDTYKHAKIPLAHESLMTSAHTILTKKENLLNLLAYVDDRPIGAISLLLYKDTMYDWYAGGLHEYRNRHPNDILPWTAMKWGIEHGYNIFDFGGAGKPGENYGVRDFKKQYGGIEVNYGRYERIFNPVKLQIAKIGLKIISKMR
jgi:serine/alanine adding enzyme